MSRMKDLFTDMEEQQVEIEHQEVLSIVKHPIQNEYPAEIDP